MNDDLKQQDAADEAAAHDFMDRSVMCAEVTLTGATARSIARYISNLEVESDNDLAGVQALCKELMATSEALVKQNAELKIILEGEKRDARAFERSLREGVNILREVSAEPLSEQSYDHIATFVRKHGAF